MRSAAITIDIDSLRFYRAIHGIRDDDEFHPDFEPIYHTALPRFFALLAEVGVPATLFVIGQDAARYSDAFTPVAANNCEIASHSYRHDYRMSRWDPAKMEADLDAAERVLTPLDPSGRIDGFRAPGYNVSPTLLEIVERKGYRYDSSLLPAPLYWGARAAAIFRYSLKRRSSASILGHPYQFAGPLAPYRMRPTRPWRPTPQGLVEVPMAVHPITRTPLIGTSWVLFPEWLRQRWLRQALARLPVFNFEMHAIDLLDATDRGLSPTLAAAQPDLRVPFRQKRSAFLALFRQLASERTVRTLRSIAAETPGSSL